MGWVRDAAYDIFLRAQLKARRCDVWYSRRLTLPGVALRRAVRSLAVPTAAVRPPPFPVDVVYTWVDSSDPAWQADFEYWRARTTIHHSDAASRSRFTDRAELLYSLRSIEKYAPWVRRIYVVTRGHTPRWLRDAHPRLTIVTHASIFDDPSHLPTFSSNAIETHLWQIEGLSEHFIYMNDDLFLMRPVLPSDLIDEDGSVRITLEGRWDPRPWAAASVNSAMQATTNDLVERRLGSLPARHRLAYHGPVIHRRSVHRQLAREFADELQTTSASRFRSPSSICLIQVLYPQVALHRGLAKKGTITWVCSRFGEDDDKNHAVFRFIDQVAPQVCSINDAVERPEVDGGLLIRFLEEHYPCQSSFEK